MTTTTSPAPTVSPALTLISFTAPAFSAVMLFSIFMASSTHDGLAGLDLLADLDEHLHDRALHRHGHIARCHRPRPTRAAAPPSSVRLRTAAPTATAIAGGLRHPGRHLEALAVDLDIEVTAHPRRFTLGDRRSGRIDAPAFDDTRPLRSSVSSTHFVECFAAAKSGCSRIAMSAGMVVCTPSIFVLLQRPDGSGDRRVAVPAPHDELAR